MSAGTAKSTIAMAVNEQRLRHMILGTGHHQPAPVPSWLSANQARASTAFAMRMRHATAVPSQQGYRSPYMITPPPPLPPVGRHHQYTEFLALAAVDLAKRGATLHGSLCSHQIVASYKRKRDEQSAPMLSAAHAQHQTIVVDPLLLDHASKMWEALAKQRQNLMRLVTTAAEDRASKRLKAKDEEIKHIRCVNRALQERIRNLHMQVKRWHDTARSNEVAANVLRSDLKHVLDAQAVRGRGVEDASSCCWGDYHGALCGDEVRKPEAAVSVGRCKGCGQGGAEVLLLPCRHLCVCAPCAAAARACPACGCAKTGRICVSFS